MPVGSTMGLRRAGQTAVVPESDDAAATGPVPIGGHVAPGYEPVRDAFAANFAERGEVGAAVCVRVRGEVVVDLWGGWADEARTRPWCEDTLVNVYSVGKAVAAALVLRLVDEGRLALDQPVADVWPEFAVGGKAGATVAHALSHQAGVPAIREPLTNDDLWDWDAMTAALAATDAWYEPGSRLIYHTNTYGHLVGGLVHRVTGERPGGHLRALVDGWGLDRPVDYWIGVPDADLHRCADVVWAPSGLGMSADLDPDSLEGDARLLWLAYFNPPGYSSVGVVNTREWRQTQVPSTNAHASARGVCDLYAAILGDLGGEPLVSPALLADATRPWVSGPCPVLGEVGTFGLGFIPTNPRRSFFPNPHSFGHFGTGGAVGCADPGAGIAFGYVMNHVVPRWQSSRNRALLDTLAACL